MRFQLCKLSILVTVLAVVSVVHAADESALARTYEIIEPDALEQIHALLLERQKDGTIDRINKQTTEKARNYVNAPKPVAWLTPALQSSSRLFNPSFTVRQNITTPDGRIVALAGTKINPLEKISLPETLIFFDGSDAKQVEIAADVGKKAKMPIYILTGGNPMQLMHSWPQSKVYFDQRGLMSQRYALVHVPSIITQEGLMLRIREISVQQ